MLIIVATGNRVNCRIQIEIYRADARDAKCRMHNAKLWYSFGIYWNLNRNYESGSPNGVTNIAGLPGSNCQRRLAAKLKFEPLLRIGKAQWRKDYFRPASPELSAATRRKNPLFSERVFDPLIRTGWA